MGARDTKEPEQLETKEVIEREINLALLNDKLNYLISGTNELLRILKEKK